MSVFGKLAVATNCCRPMARSSRPRLGFADRATELRSPISQLLSVPCQISRSSDSSSMSSVDPALVSQSPM